MVAATEVAHIVATTSIWVGAILEEKLLHLRMICNVPTNNDIPAIWTSVSNAKIQQKGHSHLVTYLMIGMLYYMREFRSYADLMHCIILLCNFVTGNRFVNPGRGTPSSMYGGCQCGHPSNDKVT